VRSMTGYGRAQVERGGVQVSAEVRSLNQRFLEVKLNLPRGWGEGEAALRKQIGAVVSRGRVEVVIRVNSGKVHGSLTVNEPLARSYVKELRALQSSLRLSGTLSVEALLQRPEIFQIAETEPDIQAELKLAQRALTQALKAFDQERQREGRALGRDLLGRLGRIQTAVRQIARLSEESRQAITALFQQRMRELVANLGMEEMRLLDEKRLYEEAAGAAQRADITEELTRLSSHLEALEKLLQRPEPIGKEAEFWLQEVGREVNTIGSKSQNAALSKVAVAIKGELEKMREQVQNIE
jgi:uncharacterized protein (TIGR00255 family)